MLAGRALYLTALGAQPSDLPREGRFPLLYFVTTTSESRWQIGRLIDRINDLGTTRLAALMKLDKLRDAGFLLRDVEDVIGKAKESVQEISHVRATQDAKHMQNKVEELSRYIGEIESLFEKIDQIGDDPEIGQNPIDYRLDRARYYIRHFRSGIEALRLGRVEGFQRYDLFVERRLGSAFDFIDRLTVRVDRVRRDREALIQYYLAQSAAVIGVNIEKTNEKIHLLNSRLTSMQGIAEFALFAVLLPYYAISLSDHVVSGIPFLEDGKLANKFIIVAILTVCWVQARASFDQHLVNSEISRKWAENMRQLASYTVLAWFELALIVGALIWVTYSFATR